jgi:hypothetical protein
MVVVEGNSKYIAQEGEAVQEARVTEELGSVRGHVTSPVPIHSELLGYGMPGAISAPTHHQNPIHVGLGPAQGGASRICGGG